MSWKTTAIRLGLATMLALLCAACQSTSLPVPESGVLELRPISPADRRFSEVVLVGQAARPDGAWIFSHLAPGDPDADLSLDSISVLTDVTGETYYELFELQGETIDNAAWTSDEVLLLHSRAWKRSMILELDENRIGPPQLTAQSSPTSRRPPREYRYPLSPDALAPAASYRQVNRPWPTNSQ